MFELKKLGDIATLTVGYVGNMAQEYTETGVPFLRSLNIKPFHISKSDIRYISEEFNMKIKKSILRENDVVIVRTGIPGTCCVVPKEYDGCNCSDIVIVHPDKTKVNPDYLAAYINVWGQKQINNNKVGAIQQHFNVRTAEDMLIALPPLKEQKKIAEIIKNINEKIVLNQKINDNLHQQAQLVFDYMFPDVSCGSSTIGDEITPKRGKPLLSKDAIVGNVPVVAGGLEPATYHNIANTQPPVLTISGSGANAGFVNLWNIPVWSSDSSYIDSTMTPYVYFWFSLLKRRQQDIFNVQTGSAQPHIYPKHIAELSLVKIDYTLVQEYTTKVTPLFTAIGCNYQETKQLQSLRDWLLPMLMNGQATIDN